MSSGPGSASSSIPEEKFELYHRFSDGRMSRSRAKELIGDDWEEVRQIVSIRRARESNRKNGYSAEEFTGIFG